jgi:hypothetical protein
MTEESSVSPATGSEFGICLCTSMSDDEVPCTWNDKSNGHGHNHLDKIPNWESHQYPRCI